MISVDSFAHAALLPSRVGVEACNEVMHSFTGMHLGPGRDRLGRRDEVVVARKKRRALWPCGRGRRRRRETERFGTSHSDKNGADDGEHKRKGATRAMQPYSLQNPPNSMILPAGWVRASDVSSGRPYFANPTTGETRWDPPPGTTTTAPPPPPSLPPPPPPAVQQPRALPLAAPTQTEPFGLVSKAQVLVQAESQRRDSSASPSASSMLEYPDMSAGMLADLCHIQRQNTALQAPYTPVQPLLMSSSDKPPHMEEGRLDIRMATLYDQLGRIR